MPSKGTRVHAADLVLTADDILLGVVREVTGAFFVVEQGSHTLFIPCITIPPQAHADATVILALTAAEVAARNWETPPDLGAPVDAPLTVPAHDVDLATAPDYAGAPYEPGLETDEAYLDSADIPAVLLEPIDAADLLPGPSDQSLSHGHGRSA